jgi:hypothetical protein
MSAIVKLACVSCGAALEIGPDLDQLACGYCGTSQMVKRSGGAISLAPLVEGIRRVERGVDRTAAELAIKRLEGELGSIRRQEADLARRYQRARSWRAVGVLLLILGGVGLVGGIAVPGGTSALGTSFFFLFAGGVVIFYGETNARQALAAGRVLTRDVETRERELVAHRETVKL